MEKEMEQMEQFRFVLAARDRLAEARKKAGLEPAADTTQPKTKKIVALSCGKKNGMCETFIKAAAIGAEELGVETEIIRAQKLKVEPCRACYACNAAILEGKLAKCPIKDDASWILEKTMLGENALIVSAPVYHLFSNALLLAILQRTLPTIYNHLEVLKKTKVAGIISMGGGMDGWTSLGLTIPSTWVQHFARVTDQVQVEARYTDVDWFERAKKLGRNVARAMGMPIEQVKYVGSESPFSCPVCHCDVLQMPGDRPRALKPGEHRYKPSHVVCPVCWVHGNLNFEGDTLKVKWDEWDVEHARLSEYGILEHFDLLIRNMTGGTDVSAAKIFELPAKYASYGKFIKP